VDKRTHLRPAADDGAIRPVKDVYLAPVRCKERCGGKIALNCNARKTVIFSPREATQTPW